MGVQGLRPLPEREMSSHIALLPGGPQARQKHYEWMSEGDSNEPVQTSSVE